MRSTALLSLFALLVFAPTATAQVYGGGFEKVFKWYGEGSGDAFGGAIAGVGDLNGDAVGDILVGSYGYDLDPLTPNVGLARLFSGSDGSLLLEHQGSSAWENLGSAVASLGDLDADQVPDYAISATGAPQGPHDGVVSVYSGASHSLLYTIPTPLGAESFGESLAALGDVSGDGVPDLAVGASSSDSNGFFNNGAVYVHSGADGSLLRTYTGEENLVYLGMSVANAGDVDGDGFDDLLAGALWTNPAGLSRAGSAFVWSGATGLQLHRFDGSMNDQRFGEAVGPAGDANGDGVPDLAVGAPADGPVSADWHGSVTVFSGADGSQIHRYMGEALGENLGASIDLCGDVDEDGRDDILVGAPGWQAYGGRAYVLNGLGQRLHIFESEGWNHEFGQAVAGLGDHDGDGDLDVLVGATRAWDNGPTPGGAYLYSFEPFLLASASSVSAAAGGTVVYEMDFPGEYVQVNQLYYAMLASASGSGPTVLQGWQIPLTRDALFVRTLQGNYPPALQGGAGALDVNGAATATLTFAPGAAAGLVGRSFLIAALYYEDASWIDPPVVHGVSRAVTLEILP